jgi:hypothetical protein
MNDQPDHLIRLSLPRPQKPLPPRKEGGKGRFESLADMVRDAWKEDQVPPSHAWIRYSLSAGSPLDTFIDRFKSVAHIKHAFGRRVFVHPVRMDHHELELEDFDHLTNPVTGGYEIELNYRKKRCDGGTHFFFAVESSAEERQRTNSRGLDALDALESMVRIALGAMTVVDTRRTLHVDLTTGAADDEMHAIHVYGPAELPRCDELSLASAIELAEASANVPFEVAGRLTLGMRWANMAFKQHDLLSFWTAIEVLADCRGHKVYVVFAKAYGLLPRRAQTLAKELGLDVIYSMRGNLAHDGVPVHLDVGGASYLNALIHDLARYVAGLPCLHLAKNALAGHQVNDWIKCSEDYG